MARFLTQEWLDAVAAAIPSNELGTVRFTLQQIVKGTPEGDVCYVTTFGDGRVSAELGATDNADVTITQDHATAMELAGGELIAQAAFMQGKLKVTGSMGSLLQNQAAIAALGRAMSAVPTGL
jgi:putative sterol carrier protein